jgi:hypothetical protein
MYHDTIFVAVQHREYAGETEERSERQFVLPGLIRKADENQTDDGA